VEINAGKSKQFYLHKETSDHFRLPQTTVLIASASPNSGVGPSSKCGKPDK